MLWMLAALMACRSGAVDTTTGSLPTDADADTDSDSDSDSDADTDADPDTDDNTCDTPATGLAFPIDTQAAFEASMAVYFEDQASPGAAVAIAPIQTGELWAGSVGLADLDGDVPWEVDAPYPIGSVSKVFTTTLVMQFVEEGVFSLDDPIDLWVSTVWDGEGITLRDLEQHTSGIVSYNYIGSFDGSLQYTPQELVDWAALHGPELLFAPGTVHEYSNTNYVLLGMAIEAASGRTFEDELQDRILTPLQLCQTTMATENPPDLVHGYQGDPLYDATEEGHPTMGWAAGGMVSTPAELALFGAALFGGQLLQPSSLGTMTTPLLIDGQPTNHGMGLFGDIGPEYGGYWGHTGGIGGHLTYMYYLESEDSVVVAMVNSFEGTDVDTMANAAWEVVLFD